MRPPLIVCVQFFCLVLCVRTALSSETSLCYSDSPTIPPSGSVSLLPPSLYVGDVCTSMYLCTYNVHVNSDLSQALLDAALSNIDLFYSDTLRHRTG